ncbi:MAG: HupE/UreJ family protein [Hyphomicrobiaceae bacterium]
MVLATSPALAHSAGEAGNGLLSGMAHPNYGWDHVIAMVAVSVRGAFLGVPAIWTLPVVSR